MNLIKLEAQLDNISGNMARLTSILDSNTSALNKYGENLATIFSVQKTLCEKVTESNELIKENDKKINSNTTDIAVLKERLLQFKKIGVYASVFVAFVGAYKILYSIIP